MYNFMHEYFISLTIFIATLAALIGMICVKLGGKKERDFAIKCFKVVGAMLFGTVVLVFLRYMPQFLEWITEGIIA